jgi:hypothetical protein
MSNKVVNVHQRHNWIATCKVQIVGVYLINIVLKSFPVFKLSQKLDKQNVGIGIFCMCMRYATRNHQSLNTDVQVVKCMKALIL